MNDDSSVKTTLPLSALASYAGAGAVLLASRLQPSPLKTVLSVGCALAMAFYSAETHMSTSALRGHKHSAVVSLFTAVAFSAQALRTRTLATVAAAGIGWGLSAVHYTEWRALLDKRVAEVRAQIAANESKP